MKTPTYTQCKMVKGTIYQVAFIPTKFANVGKYVDLHIRRQTWDRGWKVTEVGGTYPESFLQDHETDYKRTRKASDI